MIEKNTFPYKIIKKEEAVIKDEESFETDWYMGVNLFVVSDGSKFGVAYNKKEWSDSKVEYVVLIDCKWEHIDILDTEFGAYVIAYLKGKCCCYSVFGEWDASSISIIASQICDCVYDDIKYMHEKCERVLLFRGKDNMKYYDMKLETISQEYNWVYPIDNEFIECCKDNYISRVNINNKMKFPSISPVHFVCKYSDGCVYHIFTNRNCAENQWESYLLFYSKKQREFYKTSVYDKINILGIAENCYTFYMFGFEGIKKEQKSCYITSNEVWSDDDIQHLTETDSTKSTFRSMLWEKL